MALNEARVIIYLDRVRRDGLDRVGVKLKLESRLTCRREAIYACIDQGIKTILTNTSERSEAEVKQLG